MIAHDRIRLTGPPALFPPRLEAGSTIGVAAVSGAVDPSRLETGMRRLAELGYRVVEATNLRSRRGDFAGSDEERARGLAELFRDERVDAIFLARGGWGAARSLDLLDIEAIRAHPKIVMGGSDATALFARIRARTGLVCFHGPMVAVDLARQTPDADTLKAWPALLRGRAPAFDLGEGDVVNRGTGAGPVVGGCLSVVASLEGSKDAIETEGRLLFLEDVSEELYRIDRLLCQLARAGRLEAPAGVIIGALERITHNGRADEGSLAALLEEYFFGRPYPVVRNFPAGHGRRNLAFPLGVTARVDTAALRVAFDGPGVR